MLQEVVEALGGWEAAVFLDSGMVNLDVDVAAWPIEDQVRQHRVVPSTAVERTSLCCINNVDTMLVKLEALSMISSRTSLGACREDPQEIFCR